MSDLPPQLTPKIAVQDAVHGRIWLTEVEVELINTPEFQRLRWVSQLGGAQYVFPGATHTRFAHSIGAMHVMGWILRQRKMQEWFAHDDERRELVPLLRLAALLHDIGHLPFSHVGETAWSSTTEVERYVDGPETVFDVAARPASGRGYHEVLSEKLIRGERIASIIDAKCPAYNGVAASQAVAEIVGGRFDNPLALHLLSSELDCDRLDYLVRDSRAAGLVYGDVDLAYLIGNLVVADHGGEPMLAIDRDHGLVAGEHYLLARYFHYAQFVTHKTIESAELTLLAALLELLRLRRLPGPEQLEQAVEDPAGVDVFLRLTDNSALTCIAQAAAENPKEEHLAEAAMTLAGRTLMKCARREDEFGERRGGREVHVLDQLLRGSKKKGEFSDRHGVDPACFCYASSSRRIFSLRPRPTTTSYVSEPEQVGSEWLKSAKVRRPDGSLELLVEESHVLRPLKTHEWQTRRVFVREPRLDAQDKAKRRHWQKLRDALEEELRSADADDGGS